MHFAYIDEGHLKLHDKHVRKTTVFVSSVLTAAALLLGGAPSASAVPSRAQKPARARPAHQRATPHTRSARAPSTRADAAHAAAAAATRTTATTAAPAATRTTATTAAPAVAPAPLTPATTRLRHEEVGLGHATSSLAAPTATSLQPAHLRDEAVANRVSLASPRARAATPRPAATPLDTALDGIEKTVLARHRKASGRAVVAFDIDRTGHLSNVMVVVGFDRTLEPVLEAQLGAASLPARFAGQRVETTLMFKNGVMVRR